MKLSPRQAKMPSKFSDSIQRQLKLYALAPWGVMLIFVVFGAWSQAQTFTTLYNFTDGSDGGYPYAGVIQDPNGYLYGTTSSGGQYCNDCGVVYKVDTAGTETVLHSFAGPDGAWPVAPLIRDSKGDLYGTTYLGGVSGNGTVFKIDTAGKEKVLYSFSGRSDGCWPSQGLVLDEAGNLYGTTSSCGSSFNGTIFKVDNAGKFALLHSFTGGSDGAGPAGGHLRMDKSGNLYGVASMGGADGCGVLYELSKSGTAGVLYSFRGGSDGCNPVGSVVHDKVGNLYGTTSAGGSNKCDYVGCGTIWKVSEKGRETILHSFAGGTSDGCYLQAGVARDSEGNLFGVAAGCGAYGYGALYELSAKDTLTLLHSFDLSDGVGPWGEVLRTTKGTLYGTTVEGGPYGVYGYGTVWEYVP